MSSDRRFASVVLDVDSTVTGIEGIDWLATLRGPVIATRVAELTRQAMNARMSLQDVYGERLRLVAPTSDEVEALARAYIGAVAPGCREAITAMHDTGIRVILVSGGLREAILPLAEQLGVDSDDVYAVGIRFRAGEYSGFDREAALATSGGKRLVVEHLGLSRPILAVGDGVTDLEMKPAVDVFGAFTGFVRREPVVSRADLELRSFGELLRFVIPHERSGQELE
jgi:phosphoserine phosphatase